MGRREVSFGRRGVLLFRIYVSASFVSFLLSSLRPQMQSLKRTCEMCSYSLIPDARGKRFSPETRRKVMCILFFILIHILSEHEAAGISSGISEPRQRREARKDEAEGGDPRLPCRPDVCHQAFIYAAR